MKTKYSVAVVPNKAAPKKNGLFPLRLRLTIGGKRDYFAANIACTLERYKQATTNKPKPKGEAETLRKNIEIIKQRAEAALREMDLFSASVFKQKFFNKASDNNDVFAMFNQVVEECREQERAKTAKSYQDAGRSFRAFVEGDLLRHKESGKVGKKKTVGDAKPFRFENITPQFLEQYVKKMNEAGNSATTAGIYIRSLCAIFNKAVQKGIVPKEAYPFGNFKTPKGRNNKRPLGREQFLKLFEMQDSPELTNAERQALGFFLFSAFCNGMNMTDVFRLRRSNIYTEDGISVIHFVRKKTERSSNQKIIKAAFVPSNWKHIEKIIDAYGNADTRPEALLFPFFANAETEERKSAITASLTRRFNKRLKSIAEKAGINLPVSTIYARHTFSTLMQRKGLPLSQIADFLGHHDTKTTENYLGGFPTHDNAAAVAKAFDFLPNTKEQDQ